MTRGWLIGCVAVALTTTLAGGVAPPKELVKARLLADTTAIKPGEPFTVGVLLKIEPAWHVYWKNPGDSGLPTRVKWTLPEGFSAGELQYPLPTHFDQPGDIAGFGYEDEVMLLATITPPVELDASDTHEIAALVTYLACDDICVPGKQTVSVTLPVEPAVAAKPANVEAFEPWRSRLPVDGGNAGSPVTAECSGTVGGAWSRFTVALRSPQALNDVQVFLGDTDAVDVKDITVEPAGERVNVRFQARVFPGQTPKISVLPVLVTYRVSGHDRAGVSVDVPLGISPQPKTPEGGSS
ncbi:MAG: protein-disulfide reductase DsbD domain-containing protein [Tepidisphaeraceae bacterium]